VVKDVKVEKQRLQMYVEDLRDLPRERLEQAFVRARRELVYFPQIAELRKLAGEGPVEEKRLESVGANAAWEEVLVYVEKHGTDSMPVYVRGKGLVPPPPLPPRTVYALRRIGGLMALRDLAEDKFPFLLRDFVAGWNEFPLAADQPAALTPAPALALRPGPEEIAAKGEPVSFGEVMKQAGEVIKAMPEVKDTKPKISPRFVSPALQLTREQIEQRKAAERAEIERELKRADGGKSA
jgi:hypothetical protein